ncbi:hypothetical protein LBMAG43_18460 [Methylococcaceae bacterium]|nr:hypothetical protein LBMAG43_18460 [Methylococcaceae bacterium]
MSGLITNAMSRSEILTAMRSIPTTKYFVWDGLDEDNRPATDEELKRGRGRPSGSTKTQIALRVDNHVLNAFKALIVINEKIKGTQSNPIRKPRLKSLKNSPTKRLTATSQSLINQVKKNADSNAEFSILLSGVKSLTMGDFVL